MPASRISADIFLLARVGEGAEHLVHQHVGEADDGVERRAQLVAHHGEEAALGDVELVGAGAHRGDLGAQRGDLVVRPQHRDQRSVRIAGADASSTAKCR